MTEKIEKLTPNGRKTKKFARTPNCDHLSAFMDEESINAVELSRRLGVSDGTVAGWLGRGDAPKWTQLAIECFRRRRKQNATSPQFYIVTSTPEASPAKQLVSVAEALGYKIRIIEE